MSGRNRVVFFHIGSGVFGGGSKMLLRLLQSLDREQFDPVLLSQTNDELCRRASEDGIEVEIIPFRGALDTYNRQLLSKPYLLPSAAFRILQFNKDVRSVLRDSDVIWCKNLRAVLTLYPYLVTTRTPSIWNIGLGLESEGKVKYLNSLALRAVDHIFIESEIQAERTFTDDQYASYHRKFTTFHKGIDVGEFDHRQFDSHSNNNGFRIGTAASFTPRKGITYLIESFSDILEEYDDASLLIAGKPPEGSEKYGEQLQNQVNHLGIEESVEFLGWVEDMPQYLSTLDVFVLPSLNEGIPGSVREALAMKVPVVATDVGGTSEVVLPGKTGYLVEPGEAEQISEKVTQLLSNQSKRTMFRKQGRKHIVENFSIEGYVRDYENFLKQSLYCNNQHLSM